MKILYAATQPPGWGGASTEAYQTIKRLRALGHEVTGLFIDHCAKACHKLHLPYDTGGNWSDPDNIGDIRQVGWCKRTEKENWAGPFDVVIGKNYEAGRLTSIRQDIPSIFVSSGIAFFSDKMTQPFTEIGEPVPKTSHDYKAFLAVNHVFIHSTIDMQYYKRWLCPSLQSKIFGGVIQTPDIAVPDLTGFAQVPYMKREYDFCFSASSWTRTMKGGTVAADFCRRLPKAKIVVAGVAFPEKFSNVTQVGLITHNEMVQLLGQCRTVVIPSLYYPSPNLYAEAISMGCNLIVSPNVGNITGHPSILLASDLKDGILLAGRRAEKLTGQQSYRKVDPEATTREFAKRLEVIVERSMHSRKVKVNIDTLKAAPPKATTPKPAPRPTIIINKKDLLSKALSCLACPRCGSSLAKATEKLACTTCKSTFPIINGVLVFTEDEYVGSFSDEWSKHRFTQIDSRGYNGGYSELGSSSDTFFVKTGFSASELTGKVVLDAGCGCGRFSEIVAPIAGLLFCIDKSDAVFRCQELLAKQQNTIFIKGDLTNLPIKSGVLDFAFSVGVIHHTADPQKSLNEVFRAVAKNGHVAIWVYRKGRSYDSPQRAKIRAFFTDPKNSELAWQFAQLAPALRDLRSHKGWDALDEVLGISGSTNDTECVLDTFDWLTPVYQFQYTHDEFSAMLIKAGAAKLQQLPYPVSFRCIKG